MSKWADVAVLKRTKGLDGRFVVHSTAGLPFIISPSMHVHFAPPVLDAPRVAIVLSVDMLDEHSAVVSFEGVETLDIANMLLGCHILVSSDLARFTTNIKPRSNDLVGYELVDKDLDFSGTVLRILENAHQSIIVVESSQKEVLVPFVEEIVISINHEKKSIEARLPAGLLDL